MNIQRDFGKRHGILENLNYAFSVRVRKSRSDRDKLNRAARTNTAGPDPESDGGTPRDTDDDDGQRSVVIIHGTNNNNYYRNK